jgi:hypothetical protein
VNRRVRLVVAFLVAVVGAPAIFATPASAAATTVDIIYAPSSPIVANSPASFMAHISPFASGRTISWYVNGGLAGQSITNPNGNAAIELTFGAGGYGIKAVLEPIGGADRAESNEFLLMVTQDPGRLADWFFLEWLEHPTIGAKGDNAQIAIGRGATDTWMSITAIDTATNATLNLELRAPTGSTLEPGVYTSDASNLWATSGSGCGSGSVTRFEILSMTRDTAGVPISFVLSFSFLCNADQFWPIVGAIRYNSKDPVRSLSLPTGSPAFGAVIAGAAGAPRTFAITNDGDANATIGQIDVGAADAADFQVSADACSGSELEPDTACAFDVTFAPASSGPKSAELVIPSDMGLSPRRLAIGGQGLIPETVSMPVVKAEQQYFTPGIRYEATVSPNPEINSSECLVDGEHLDGSPPDEHGIVRCIAPRPDAGEHTVVIRYLGSVFHGEATSPVTSFLIDPSTATSVALSDETAPSNVPVTVTAIVEFHGDVSYPGGTVTISDEATNAVIAAGEVGPADPSIQVAAMFATGPHHLVATYSGITSTEDPSSGSADLSIGAPDLIAPTASAPVRSLVTGSMSDGKVPVRLAWTGNDVGSGVDHFVLRQQTDGGTWSAPLTVAGTSTTRNLPPGHTYRFNVRAVDNAANTSDPAYGASFRLRGFQQSSSLVHYHGTWATSTSTTWWGGTAKSSSAKGSTASFTFTGKSIAWVGLKAATRGKAYVYINGVLKATVNLYSATTLRQRIVWSANYASSATRTITIKVLGTAGRPRVDIDGFIVGS